MSNGPHKVSDSGPRLLFNLTSALKAVSEARLKPAPPHVRQQLTSRSRAGFGLILLGLVVDLGLAVLVLGKETSPDWVLALVLLGPGVFVMMLGAHLISRKFSGAIVDLVLAIRGKAAAGSWAEPPDPPGGNG